MRLAGSPLSTAGATAANATARCYCLVLLLLNALYCLCILPPARASTLSLLRRLCVREVYTPNRIDLHEATRRSRTMLLRDRWERIKRFFRRRCKRIVTTERIRRCLRRRYEGLAKIVDRRVYAFRNGVRVPPVTRRMVNNARREGGSAARRRMSEDGGVHWNIWYDCRVFERLGLNRWWDFVAAADELNYDVLMSNDDGRIDYQKIPTYMRRRLALFGECFLSHCFVCANGACGWCNASSCASSTGGGDGSLTKCPGCNLYQYCSEACRRRHWKTTHAPLCSHMARLAASMKLPAKIERLSEHRHRYWNREWDGRQNNKFERIVQFRTLYPYGADTLRGRHRFGALASDDVHFATYLRSFPPDWTRRHGPGTFSRLAKHVLEEWDKAAGNDRERSEWMGCFSSFFDPEWHWLRVDRDTGRLHQVVRQNADAILTSKEMTDKVLSIFLSDENCLLSGEQWFFGNSSVEQGSQPVRAMSYLSTYDGFRTVPPPTQDGTTTAMPGRERSSRTAAEGGNADTSNLRMLGEDLRFSIFSFLTLGDCIELGTCSKTCASNVTCWLSTQSKHDYCNSLDATIHRFDRTISQRRQPFMRNKRSATCWKELTDGIVKEIVGPIYLPYCRRLKAVVAFAGRGQRDKSNNSSNNTAGIICPYTKMLVLRLLRYTYELRMLHKRMYMNRLKR